MLFAFVWTVWAKNAICTTGWAWASAKSGAADGSVLVACWEVMSWDPNGRVHRSVDGSFSPCKIIFPLYVMIQSPFVNVMSHPTSVRIHIPKSEAMDRSGMMCPVKVTGRPSIWMSHMCVDMTWQPSASATLSGCVVGRLLIMGVPSITKIWVAPESAIACFVGSWKTPPASS
jgi:hypothetical protein